MYQNSPSAMARYAYFDTMPWNILGFSSANVSKGTGIFVCKRMQKVCNLSANVCNTETPSAVNVCMSEAPYGSNVCMSETPCVVNVSVSETPCEVKVSANPFGCSKKNHLLCSTHFCYDDIARLVLLIQKATHWCKQLFFLANIIERCSDITIDVLIKNQTCLICLMSPHSNSSFYRRV